MKKGRPQDPRLEMTTDALEAANRRAMPQVAISGTDSSPITIGIAIACAIGVFTFSQMNAARLRKAASADVEPVVIAQPASAPEPAPLPPRPEPAPFIPSQAYQSEEPTIQPDRLRAPALVVDNSVPADPKPAASAQAGATASEQFALRASATELPPASAASIEDLSSVILEGAIIAGVLETAINSDLPGYVRAIVSEDVRSFDGLRTLIPRGSRIIGQYRSGLAIGESRAFVIWTRLLLPDGASIRLGSPATDALGRAGLGGSVDRHFVQRFGSAILLSVIGAGLQALAFEGDGQVIVGSSNEAFAVAQAALQANINIPPTIKVPQGSLVRIFVARDLYFPEVAPRPFSQQEAGE